MNSYAKRLIETNFAKMTGKVTSLISRKDQLLATKIEEAIAKNESLESLSVDSIRRDVARSRINEQKDKNEKMVRLSSVRNKDKPAPTRSSKVLGKPTVSKKSPATKSGNAPVVSRGKKTFVKVSRTSKPTGPKTSTGKTYGANKPSGSQTSKSKSYGAKKPSGSQKSGPAKSTSKLNVVGFRGRSAAKAT